MACQLPDCDPPSVEKEGWGWSSIEHYHKNDRQRKRRGEGDQTGREQRWKEWPGERCIQRKSRKRSIQEGGLTPPQVAQGSLWPDCAHKRIKSWDLYKTEDVITLKERGCNTQGDHPRLRNKTSSTEEKDNSEENSIWIHLLNQEEEPWELMVNTFSKAKVESGSSTIPWI